MGWFDTFSKKPRTAWDAFVGYETQLLLSERFAMTALQRCS